MGRIIRTCSLSLVAACLCVPALADAKTEDVVDLYTAARLAEIGNRSDDALKGYIRLYRKAPDSDVLVDRIFDSAIRAGDMAAALRAVRAQELSGEVSSEAPLLLFADAFRRKNWPMALLAADELSTRSNFRFIAPTLRSWVNVARGAAPNLPAPDPEGDPLFTYYSDDQRLYLALAAGEYATAKLGLRTMASSNSDYTRDLMLRAVPVIADQGDGMFADALLSSAIGTDRLAVNALPVDKQKAKMTAQDGLSALHVRIASALLEQNVNDQALVLARIALWHAPDYDPAKLILAKALSAQGLEATASDILKAIPQTSYYWPQSIRERAGKLAPDAALALARDALQRLPNSLSLALLVAQFQEAAGDVAGAADSYRALAEAADKGGFAPRQRAVYRLWLASALDNNGNWSVARSELDAALVIDPNNAQILNYLGYSMLEANEDVPRAMAMVRKAFEISPDSTAIMDSMGWAYFQTGDYPQAVALLEKATKISSNDLAINEHLGDAYWRTGRYRDARFAWRAAAQGAEGEAATRLSSKIDMGLTQNVSMR
ncbi:MAG: tetratricopeptide repeat protein [Sphingorhabdus sp.]